MSIFYGVFLHDFRRSQGVVFLLFIKWVEVDLVVLFCLLTFVLPTITNHSQNRQTTQSNATPIIALIFIHPCH